MKTSLLTKEQVLNALRNNSIWFPSIDDPMRLYDKLKHIRNDSSHCWKLGLLGIMPSSNDNMINSFINELNQ